MRTFSRITGLVPVFPVVTTVFLPFMKRTVIYRHIPFVIGVADINNLRVGGLYRGFLPGLFQLQFVPLKTLLVHALPLIFNRIIIIIETGFSRTILAYIDPGHFGSGSFGGLVRIVSDTLVVDPLMYHCGVSRQ